MKRILLEASCFSVNIALLLTILIMSDVQKTVAQIPRIINYQGKLSNLDGSPADGIYDMMFSVYDVPSSGTALWEEEWDSESSTSPTVDVEVQEGIFNVLLGSHNPLNLSFDKEYWLEVGVRPGIPPAASTPMPNYDILSPRQPIVSAAYAFRAASVVDGAITNDSISDTAVISDTKLGPITTPGRVSGSAISGGAFGPVDGSAISNLSGDNITSGTVSAERIDNKFLRNDQDSITTCSITMEGLCVDSNTIYVDSANNRVGIGTSSPDTTLDVTGSLSLGADSYLKFKYAGCSELSRVEAVNNGAGNRNMRFLWDNSSGLLHPFINSRYNEGGYPWYDLSLTCGDGSASSLNAKISFNFLDTDDSSPSSELMRISANGKVGIGTTNPSHTLEVNGGIKASGGDSDDWNNAYSWGNHASAGYLTSENDPQVGTISNNRVPKWNGAALVTGTIYDNGNIGVGGQSSGEKLDVMGSLDWQQMYWDAAENVYMRGSGDFSFNFTDADGNDNWHVWSPTYNSILTVRNNGRVGICASSPSAKLDIDPGSGSANLKLAESELTDNYDGVLRIRSGGNKIVFDGGDNIGIDTTPSEKLHINGSLRIGNVKFWGDSEGHIQNIGGTRDLRPHTGSGNFTVYSGNVGQGTQMLQVNSSGVVVGPATGGRWLTINDISRARWGFATGGYDLSIKNDNSGSWQTRVRITKDGDIFSNGDIYSNDRRVLTDNGNSFAANGGYQKFSSGLIIQWGQGPDTDGWETITFREPFPHACLQVVATANDGGDENVAVKNFSRTGFSLRAAAMESPAHWIAIGY